MHIIEALEHERLIAQQAVDSANPLAERNRMGQFATPTQLARDVLSCARHLLPVDGPIRFFDPAFGTGSFFSALLQAFPDNQIIEARGIEIDPRYALAARQIWRNTPLDLTIGDFTRMTAPRDHHERANLLICNPPYVRHHHIPLLEKQRLRDSAQCITGLRLNGLSGLYCYFMALAHEWMADDGLAGWLIPSEFMDVNYGHQIKEYLLHQVTLLRIHRFDPREVQFDDALVSSSVVWFRKSLPPDRQIVQFTFGGSLQHPRVTQSIAAASLDSNSKWSQYGTGQRRGNVDDTITLGDLFSVKRGIATGANEFFILKREEVERRKIPSRFLTPILPSPRYLSDEVITVDHEGTPQLARALFMLDCRLEEDEIRNQSPELWAYLQEGIAAGIHERYLCRHRSPWYAQEDRPPAPFLCTYMGRLGAKTVPFRFIRNHSCATAPNVYLMLYPKPMLQAALRDNPMLADTVWHALKHIPLAELMGEGRVYGGGLHKLEPRELERAGLIGLDPALITAVMSTPKTAVRQLVLGL